MVPYDELYDTVRGLMASEYAVAGVENLFAEGSYCQRRFGCFGRKNGNCRDPLYFNAFEL